MKQMICCRHCHLVSLPQANWKHDFFMLILSFIRSRHEIKQNDHMNWLRFIAGLIYVCVCVQKLDFDLEQISIQDMGKYRKWQLRETFI